MNIGDKVRLLHSKEEGVITGFLKGDVVEVEIEEGFKLPIVKRELSVISVSEAKFFNPHKTTESEKIESRKEGIRAENGIFLVFLPNKNIAGESMVPYIINNSDWDLPFTISTHYNDKSRGLMGGFLKAKTYQKGSIELLMKDIDTWGSFTFSAFYYTVGFFVPRPPFEKQIRFREQTFFQNRKIAPILEQEAFVFQLDAIENTEEKAFVIDVNAIKDKMFEANEIVTPQKQFSKPPAEIDLHIEKLSNDYMFLANAEILNLQEKIFENYLENAIASGMDEVIFIHGLGNGVLRNLIHKRLSQHKNIAYYADARKEKFGYGATIAKIK